MSVTMVRVSPQWLALREPADAAARSAELAARLARHLGAGPLEIHDLGGGTGAMGRWLAPRLPGPQHWVVHDLDADLLGIALADPPPGVSVEARRSDVTRPDRLDGAGLVVASALLDLLTRDALDAILRACAGIPALFALSVTGRVRLAPEDPLDARVEAAFNAHQRRDGKLGPDAVAALGPQAIVRPSPWRLGPAQAALMAVWLDGWIAAACEQDPTLEAGEYRARRLRQAVTGQLSVTVDHADVLVLP